MRTAQVLGYCLAMNQPTWPRTWTHAIGRQVAAARHAQGISAQALSDACGALGHDVPRSTLTNLENGRKATIPLDELVVIARALGVPPLDLLCPAGDDPVAYLPGIELPGDGARIEFVGSRAPHVEALVEGLRLIRRGTARVESVERAARDADPWEGGPRG